jgi:hypothetical protein
MFARETEYLGHVVSEAGITASPDKVKAILEWPTPGCVTDLRSFLGTAPYYRRFHVLYEISHLLHRHYTGLQRVRPSGRGQQSRKMLLEG